MHYRRSVLHGSAQSAISIRLIYTPVKLKID